MAVDMERIISKVEKLLALGTSSNEHEAASAVAKAQALMEAYGLAMEQVTGKKAARDDVREGEAFDVFEEGKTSAWRQEVLATVAETSGVWVATGRRHELVTSKSGRSRYARFRTAYLIGLPADVQMAGYAYSFLTGEVERLAQDAANVHWEAIKARAKARGISVHDAESEYVIWEGTHPLKAKVSFTRGAAEGVCRMLTVEARQRRQESTAEASALVVNREAIIRDYWYMKRYGKTYADFMADLDARMAAHPVTPTTVAKPLSPSAARRQAEAAERRYQRQEQSRQRAEDRKWRNTDHDAYNRGYDAGRSMSIRPGVKHGSAAGAERRIGQGR